MNKRLDWHANKFINGGEQWVINNLISFRRGRLHLKNYTLGAITQFFLDDHAASHGIETCEKFIIEVLHQTFFYIKNHRLSLNHTEIADLFAKNLNQKVNH